MAFCYPEVENLSHSLSHQLSVYPHDGKLVGIKAHFLDEDLSQSLQTQRQHSQLFLFGHILPVQVVLLWSQFRNQTPKAKIVCHQNTLSESFHYQDLGLVETEAEN